MSRALGFPPIAEPDARTLILGSMPGAASLAAGRYYAHPHNAFWPIICELLQLKRDAGYDERVAALRAAHIALWDVLKACSRAGSLDSEIDRTTEVANDFATFFTEHPKITHIYFNGTKAETSFRRHVLPNIDTSAFNMARLPSTSPAHASKSRAEKLAAWRCIVDSGLPLLTTCK